MKRRFHPTGNYSYTRMDITETQDYDGEFCRYEMWYQLDKETGEILRYVFICAKDDGDTPETVSWDYSTRDQEHAWEWYYGELYKIDSFL